MAVHYEGKYRTVSKDKKEYIAYLEEMIDDDCASPYEFIGRSLCGEYPNKPNSDDVKTLFEGIGSWYPDIDEYYANKITGNYKYDSFIATNDCFPYTHNGGCCFADRQDERGIMYYKNYVISCCEHVIFMKDLFGNEQPEREQYIRMMTNLTKIEYNESK